jgi:hypothetical protein
MAYRLGRSFLRFQLEEAVFRFRIAMAGEMSNFFVKL